MNVNKLILPGWGVPSESYSEYVEGSSMVFDYGYFGTEKDLDLDELSKDINPLITNNSVLIAHSMGSAIALKTATEISDIKALVLISPFARFTADLDYLGQPPSSVEVMTKMITSRPETVLRSFYRDTFFPAKSNLNIPTQLNPLALMAGLKFLSNVDYRKLLDQIKIPVLIIQGESDQIVNPQIARYLQENLTNAEYIEVPKAGHALPLTDTDACKKAISDFLKKHSIDI